jgi:hypothetical protein
MINCTKLQLICRGLIIVLPFHSSGRIVEDHKTACPAKSHIWHLPNTSIIPYGYTKLPFIPYLFRWFVSYELLKLLLKDLHLRTLKYFLV